MFCFTFDFLTLFVLFPVYEEYVLVWGNAREAWFLGLLLTSVLILPLRREFWYKDWLYNGDDGPVEWCRNFHTGQCCNQIVGPLSTSLAILHNKSREDSTKKVTGLDNFNDCQWCHGTKQQLCGIPTIFHSQYSMTYLQIILVIRANPPFRPHTQQGFQVHWRAIFTGVLKRILNMFQQSF